MGAHMMQSLPESVAGDAKPARGTLSLASSAVFPLEDNHLRGLWFGHCISGRCKCSSMICKPSAYTERHAGHAGAVQEAARAAAAEVLKRLQQEGRLGGKVRSISGPEQGTPGSNGAGQAAAASGAPKGYKGNPYDTRADAFKKMQVYKSTRC